MHRNSASTSCTAIQYQHHAGDVRSDGVFEAAQSWQQLAAIFDVYHPYWKHRRIFFRSRGSSAGFVSTCQWLVDAGYHDEERCLGRRSGEKTGKDFVMTVALRSILPKMRQHQEQMRQQQEQMRQQQEQMRQQQEQMRQQQELLAAQQRAIDRMFEAFHDLNASVALLAQQRGACSNAAGGTGRVTGASEEQTHSSKNI